MQTRWIILKIALREIMIRHQGDNIKNQKPIFNLSQKTSGRVPSGSLVTTLIYFDSQTNYCLKDKFWLMRFFLYLIGVNGLW